MHCKRNSFYNVTCNEDLVELIPINWIRLQSREGQNTSFERKSSLVFELIIIFKKSGALLLSTTDELLEILKLTATFFFYFLIVNKNVIL